MKLLWTALACVLLTSCGDRVAKESLPGQYIFSQLGRDTLDLKSDGTYYHHTFRSGQIFKDSGTWKLNSDGDEISFKNFSFGRTAFLQVIGLQGQE